LVAGVGVRGVGSCFLTISMASGQVVDLMVGRDARPLAEAMERAILDGHHP
jgi:hypothetical protein